MQLSCFMLLQKKKTRAPESMQKVSKQWATLVSHSSARPKSYNDTCNQLLAQQHFKEAFDIPTGISSISGIYCTCYHFTYFALIGVVWCNTSVVLKQECSLFLWRLVAQAFYLGQLFSFQVTILMGVLFLYFPQGQVLHFMYA